MRSAHAPIFALALAAAAVALATLGGGCSWFDMGPPARNPITLRPIPGDPAEAAQHLYKLQIWYLTQQLGEGDGLSDFWRFLDETVLPPHERQLLAANGLRLAVGGQLAMERLNTVLPQTKGMTVRALPPFYARQGYALDIPLGPRDRDLAVLYSAPDGALSGREFPKGNLLLHLASRAAPTADSTAVTVSQRVMYGDPQTEYRKTPTGYLLAPDRPSFVFRELLRTVTIRDGQLVAVGLEPGRPVSLGEQMFVARDEAARYVTTVVLVPELVAAGAVPKGTKVLSPPPSAAPPTAGVPETAREQ